MANQFARRLRKNMTEAEQFVWRSSATGNSAVSVPSPGTHRPLHRGLVCFEAKLVIELDGGQHAARTEADAIRTHWLEGQGFRVFRVWNHEALKEWDTIAETVAALLVERSQPSPDHERRE